MLYGSGLRPTELSNLARRARAVLLCLPPRVCGTKPSKTSKGWAVSVRKRREGWAKLRQSDWREISVARLQTIWPVALWGVDCDSTVCSSVESKGRVISGDYECSEIFFFYIKRTTDAKPEERLTNLVIHYSASRKKSVITAAKMMARALKLQEPELTTGGNESEQVFDWQDKMTDISALNVEFSHTRNVWTVTLNFSRFPKS